MEWGGRGKVGWGGVGGLEWGRVFQTVSDG